MRADGIEDHSEIVVGFRDRGSVARPPFAGGGRVNAAGGQQELRGIVAGVFDGPGDVRPVAAREQAEGFGVVTLAIL
jgi:hypothetical protein